MKIRLLIYTVFFLALPNVLLSEVPTYIQINEGIIVLTNPVFTGRVTAVMLAVIADNIIRVIAAPGKETPLQKALLLFVPKRKIFPGMLFPLKKQLL